MQRHLTHPLISYLREAVWNVWVGSFAAIFTVYEIVSNFTQAPVPTIPTQFYWIGGIALLLFAPFCAFLQERRRANLYQTICRQIFEENYVFLNFGKESRKPPEHAVREGMALIEEIRIEVEAGNLTRAGMLISLFHEIYNMVLQFYGGVGEDTAKYLDSARFAIDIVLSKSYPNHILSSQLRSEAFELYQQRWSKS